jgi:hypothetical protein
MTEEDTFNTLKKSTFLEAWEKYKLWLDIPGNVVDKDFLKNREKFFNQLGWTWEEWMQQYFMNYV